MEGVCVSVTKLLLLRGLVVAIMQKLCHVSCVAVRCHDNDAVAAAGRMHSFPQGICLLVPGMFCVSCDLCTGPSPPLRQAVPGHTCFVSYTVIHVEREVGGSFMVYQLCFPAHVIA